MMEKGKVTPNKDNDLKFRSEVVDAERKTQDGEPISEVVGSPDEKIEYFTE